MTGTMTLHEVQDWQPGRGCTPTALCAVTGLRRADVDTALQRVASLRGVALTDTASVSPQDWGEALKLLGYHWDVLHDHTAPRLELDGAVRTFHGAGLLLMIAVDDKGAGHVFATCDRHIVDCWTYGKVVRHHRFPDEYRDFTVKYVLRLKPL